MPFNLMLVGAVAFYLAALVSKPVLAEENRQDIVRDGVRIWNIQGIPVTGPNDVCGEGQWILPPPFDTPDSHFTVIGEYDPDPNADNSIPLTTESCADPDVVLATHSNPALNALGGFPDGDPRLSNVPLRQVPVKAFPDGTRMSLPFMGDVSGNPFPPTRNEPSDPITVERWFQAKGHMMIRCYPDSSAKVQVRLRNLIPNATYGVYATWITTPPGANEPTFVPLAFGGVPSVLASDSRGNARFTRDFNFCPVDTAPDGSMIMFINIGYHADGTPNGAFPQNVAEVHNFQASDDGVFQSTTPPGTATLPHVQFPLNVTRR